MKKKSALCFFFLLFFSQIIAASGFLPLKRPASRGHLKKYKPAQPHPALVPKYFGIGFHKAMSSNRLYKSQFADTESHWKIVKSLYDEHVVNNPKILKHPRIPKIIHQIWLGSPLPERYKAFQKTWKKHHPH